MSAPRHPLRWLPAFVVGICAAAAAEIATGLLLYAGPGLMRSLTTVLAVESAALGIGVWTSPGPRPDLVDALRRRWMLCLVAFVLATVFSAFWSLIQAVGGSALGQGLGLAFLAGLPLYTAGGVLGAMATEETTDPRRRGSGAKVGAPAALGAALGFAATGVSLPQVLTPASLFLVCLVLLSAGGLVYGAVLDSRLRVDVRGEEASPTGPVRVEDRRLPSRDRAGRFLTDGPVVRRWVALEGDASVPWDVVALRLTGVGSEDVAPAPEPEVVVTAEDAGAPSAASRTAPGPGGEAPPPSGEILLVGGGASAVPFAALRSDPSLRVTVVERSQAVVDLGLAHLDTRMGPGPRLDVRVGNLDDLVDSLAGAFRVVVVDTASLAPLGGAEGLSARTRASLCDRVAPGGFLALGPHAHEPDVWPALLPWSTASYRRTPPTALEGLGAGTTYDEVLWMARRPTSPGVTPEAPWPEISEGFVRERVGEEDPE